MNIFKVKREEDNALYQCTIKGKVLKINASCYNPLCPGDAVLFSPAGEDSAAVKQGQITAVLPRRSLFSRRNEKNKKPQLLAANVDQVLIISSFANPPFRPRFIDRALIQCEKAGIEGIAIINKVDLINNVDFKSAVPPGDLAHIEERLAVFNALGHRTLAVSAKTGEGGAELRGLLKGKRSVFMGQSGAGKSSLVNALLGAALQKTGALVLKYDRGAHTTTMPILLEGALDGEAAAIIDTPGLRQFLPDGIEAAALVYYMRELAPLAAQCRFGASCSHGGEQGCAVQAALSEGSVHPDRWKTYTALKEALIKQ